MNGPIEPVGGVGAAPAVAPRAVRSESRVTSPLAPGAEGKEAAAAAPRRAPESGVDRMDLGGHVAEFHYDESAGRVVVKVYSGASEPREVVRQFPPEEYLQFVSKIRELVGTLFERTA